MITGLYASILTLLYVRLTLNIVGLRHQHKVSLGDGGVEELQRAIATHNNAGQYIPLFLVMLLILELNNISVWLVHVLGFSFLVGRLLHSMSLANMNFKRRVWGMKITIWSMIAVAVINILVMFYRLLV